MLLSIFFFHVASTLKHSNFHEIILCYFFGIYTTEIITEYATAYRTDSDAKVGYTRNIYGKKALWEKMRNIDFEKILRKKDDSKSVLWVTSHCETFSKREEYAEALRAHINVTIRVRV